MLERPEHAVDYVRNDNVVHIIMPKYHCIAICAMPRL